MRRTIASPSATMTSRATTTTTSTRASGTTRGTPGSASQTMKSWLLSAIRGARSRGAINHSLRKSWHTLFKCVSLRKSLNAPPLPQDGKRKDQVDDNESDKSGAQDFHDPKNVVNVIFGGNGGFPSKRAQKLTLREILSVEPAIQKPLRYGEVPISFSGDDQWTNFSKLGKFPLILDPVMAGLHLT
ncbi:putative gag-pol precursor [Panicum miliaceum]|uniref:Gag-pol n=1 Tax=Panicum miliaceum TaxID=4540 RepID=A0A3L6S3S0_PANMI|nr:putative gag-pol precursor [Panicum miliaceum]